MNIDTARKALSSSSAVEIIAGLAILGKSGSLGDLQAVLALIKHAQPEIKKAAVDAAGDLLLENLIEHYNTLSTEMRDKLGALLSSLSPDVVDELSRDLKSESDERRLRAIQIMGLLKKNPRIHDILATLVADRNERVRATVVSVLGKVISFENKELVLALLNDKDKRVRANTIEALEGLNNPRIIPILLRYRSDPSNRIRGNVLKALYSLGYKEIMEDLAGMLNNPDVFMKASALWVLTQTRLHTPALEDCAGYNLLSENEMVRTNARKTCQSYATPRSKGYLHYLDILPATPVQA